MQIHAITRADVDLPEADEPWSLLNSGYRPFKATEIEVGANEDGPIYRQWPQLAATIMGECELQCVGLFDARQLVMLARRCLARQATRLDRIRLQAVHRQTGVTPAGMLTVFRMITSMPGEPRENFPSFMPGYGHA